MGMSPDTGEIRPLRSVDDLKQGEVLFHEGELISIRGCVFRVKRIFPDPDNELLLKGTPIKVRDANMI